MRAIAVGALAASIWTVSACSQSPFEPELGLADFDVVWQEVSARYAHFELKGIDWPAVRATWRPRMEAASSGDDVEGVMTKLLAALRDPHVWLDGRDGRFNPYKSHRADRDDGAFELDNATRRIVGDTRTAAGGRVTYGSFPNDVGYIYIRNFREGEVDAGFAEALDALAASVGLVVDVRGNQGGSQAEVTSVVGRFTAEAFDGLPTFILGKPVEVPRVLPRGGSPYSGPTIVLVDGTCFSACESFAEMMMRISTVTSLGDTTAGGGGGFSTEEPGVISMPSGAQTGVPTAWLQRYDGSPMEWLGVPPDTRVQQTREEAEQGIDRQLYAAVSRLEGAESRGWKAPAAADQTGS